MTHWAQIVAEWLGCAAGITGATHGSARASAQAPSAPAEGSSRVASEYEALNLPRARPPRATAFRSSQLGFILLDLLFVGLNGFLVSWLRFISPAAAAWLGLKAGAPSPGFSFHPYEAFLALYGALVVVLCRKEDLYRKLPERDGVGEAMAVGKVVTLATLLLTAFIYLSGVKIISRLVVILAGVLNLVTLAGWRFVKRRIVIRGVADGNGARRVVIVGAGPVAQALARHFDQNLQLGYKVKGFLDGHESTDPRVLGTIEDFDRIIRTEFVDEVFLAAPPEPQLVKRVVAEARELRVGVKIIPELYDGLGWDAPIRYLGPFPVMELHREPIQGFGLICKRLLDILVSASGLLVLSPLFPLIAIAIRLDSDGPILYRSWRMGKRGRKFVCFKFRTMVADADALKEELRNRNERNGPFFKLANDPRVTRMGRFLRKYSLDELPQLWNVLCGQMSLVGPRPHPLDDYARYDLEHLRRLDVKPGLTGLWQVTARRDPLFERNLELDLEYIERWSFWLDVQIILQTFPEVLQGRGQ